VAAAAYGPDDATVVAEQVAEVAALAADGGAEALAEAMRRCGDVMAAREAARGPDQPLLRPLLVQYARLEQAAGRLPAAYGALERSLKIRERAGGGEYGADCSDELLLLGEVGGLLDRHQQARAYLDAALAAHAALLAHCEQRARDASAGGRGRAGTAAALATQMRDAGAGVAECERMVGWLLAHKGDAAGARDWYQRALATCEKYLAVDHPRAQAVRAALAGVMRALELHVPAVLLYK
jgi:tetratricopeptide (TPR) repeat protein